MQKFLLIGLGNPGKKYAATRHNAGKMFAIWLKAKSQTFNSKSLTVNPASPAGGRQTEIEIIETDCFMNSSGGFVYNTYKNYNNYKDYIRLMVAHDDLDLPLGQFKIQFGRGPHDHKGLLSIYQVLGTKNFWHVRIGTDNRGGRHCEEPATWQSAARPDSHAPPSGARNDSQYREPGETYTLKPFSREEKEKLYNVFADIRETLLQITNLQSNSRMPH